MVKHEYYEYAKRQGGVQLAALQAEFNLNYREAKEVVDALVSSGYISYDGGLDYKYVKPEEPDELPRLPIRRYRGPRTHPVFDDLESDEKVRDLFKKLRADLEEMDDEDDDEEPDWDVFDAIDDALDPDFDNFPHFDVEEECKKMRLELNKGAYESLHAVVLKMIEVKSRPVSPDAEPDHSLWSGDNFDFEVFARIEKLVLSDKKMGLKSAIKKAETYLEGVRDTHDRKMVQLYENVVYRLKTTTSYQYNLVKKYIFEES